MDRVRGWLWPYLGKTTHYKLAVVFINIALYGLYNVATLQNLDLVCRIVCLPDAGPTELYSLSMSVGKCIISLVLLIITTIAILSKSSYTFAHLPQGNLMHIGR